jgi:hypothetical protein
MAALRKADPTPESTRELDDVTEVVDWSIRTFGSYVGTTSLAFVLTSP